MRHFTVSSADIAACPAHRMDPGHYREGGSCKCGPHPLVGKRVRLVSCSDEWTRLTPGTLGTVRMVDDVGTVHVAWDDGGSLGLVPGEDQWEVIDD